MTERIAGKLGRLPGKIPVGLKDLSYYVAGPLPTAPKVVDIPQIHEQWAMLGNDEYGDCGVAGLIHGEMAAQADTSEPVNIPSGQAVVDYYLTYTGGADNGVVLSDFLAYVRKQPQGLLGDTVVNYAPLGNLFDTNTLKSVIYLYDFAYTGILVTAGMQEAFQEGQPWTVDTVDANILGGHCVPLVAYGPQGLICVTWGGIQAITWDAWPCIVQESWAVLSGPLQTADGDGRGIPGLNAAALEADLDAV